MIPTHSSSAQVRVLLALVVAIGAVIVFAVSTVAGFQFATSNRIKPGVFVLDVNVGGLSLDEAQTRLAPRASAILDQPVQLSLDQRTWTTSPREMGVRLEPTELAQRAYALGRGDRPAELLAVLHNGAELPVFEEADGARLDALVSRIAAEVYQPMRNARLAIGDDGTLEYMTSQPGLELDQQASREQIAIALTTGSTSATLLTRPLNPTVKTEQIAAAYDQLQHLLVAQPVEITAAEHQRRLTREALLELLSLEPATADKPATVHLATDPIETLVTELAKGVDQQPSNARFTLNAGRLTAIREGRDGRKLDIQQSVQLISEQILHGSRAIQLPVATVRPTVASDNAGAGLGISELIDEATTTFAGSVPEKAHNIRLAAERLHGVVVPPGGTFSFNAEVGPTTLEAGYQWGFGLTTGQGGARTVPSVAGGICQVATTLFQSVFWAGYQLEERWWHLYWIPNYTSRGVVGLDATVDADAGLDFKWINPTDDYVLIQSSAGAESITFRLYGRKPAWTVRVDEAVVSNRVAPDRTPDVQPEPLLAWGRVVPVGAAREGCVVSVARHVIPNGGGAPRDLTLKSTYQPGRNVTLVGTARAPDAASVSAAVNRVRGSLQPQPAASASAGGASAAPAATSSANSAIQTPNGPRTLAEIRAELRNAGWGGGSDEDAVATYNRLAAAARGN